jgi:hypothetical protein
MLKDEQFDRIFNRPWRPKEAKARDQRAELSATEG